MRKKNKPSDNIQICSKKRKIKSCTFLCTLMLLSAFAAGCGTSGDDSTTAAEKADTKTTVTTGPTPTLSPMPLNQMRLSQLTKSISEAKRMISLMLSEAFQKGMLSMC